MTLGVMPRAGSPERTTGARRARVLAGCAAAALLLGAASARAQQDDPPGTDKVLRVCADPNSLPFSREDGSGLENKLAEMIAQDFGWKLETTWFPQRMAYVRNTLRARVKERNGYKCDVLLNVPIGMEMVTTTQPYYRSTYAMVVMADGKLGKLASPTEIDKLPDDVKKSLRMGVFSQTPPVDWLQGHGMAEQIVSYQRTSGDPEEYPGQIIERDLAGGKLDAAFVWGPIGGYFASKHGQQMHVQLLPAAELAAEHAVFDMGMGVRFPDKAFKAKLDDFLVRRKADVDALLTTYGVPRLDAENRPIP